MLQRIFSAVLATGLAHPVDGLVEHDDDLAALLLLPFRPQPNLHAVNEEFRV